MSKRKAIAILAIIAMVLTLMPAAVFGATPDSDRLAGANRIETALEIASAGTWGNTVILAATNDANLVDALAAAPLAGQENAPILLTYKDKLDPAVKQRIVDLKATKVYVIGAVSDAVVNEVKALDGVTVEKLAGKNRIETADAINAKLTNPAGTFVVGFDAIPDALSVASYAAKNKFAIVLTDGAGNVDSSKLVGATKYIVGGTAKVKDIEGVSRISGSNRYLTNKAVADTLGFSYDRVYVANGVSLVDALAVAPLAAQYNAFVALASANDVAAAATVNAKLSTSSKVIAVGGTSVVSDSVKNILKARAIGEVTSVEGVKDQIFYDNKDGQFLGLIVNGVKATVTELENAGYEVIFKAVATGGANANVFIGDANLSTSGELSKTALKAALGGATEFKFEYTIEVKKGPLTVAISSPVEVKVLPGGMSAASSITSYKISLLDTAGGNVIIDKLVSNKLVKGEVAKVTEVKANTVDGKTNVKITDNVTLRSSNEFVISVDNTTKKITAVEAGTATVTIVSGSVTKDITFEVVTKDREASKVTVDKSSLKIATDGKAFAILTITDNYGDPFVGNKDAHRSFAVDDVVVNAAGDTILQVSASNPDNKGKVKLTLENVASSHKTGKGNVVVRKVTPDGVLGSSLLSIAVDVSAETAVNKYVIEYANADSSSYTADINPEAAPPQKEVKLYVMGYTNSGYTKGPADLAGITVVTVDPAGKNGMLVATIEDDNETIKVTGDIDTGYTGTGQVKLNQDIGGKTPAPRNITIKNTAPTITDVTFNNVGTITDSILTYEQILDLANVKTSGSAGLGKLKIADDNSGVIFYAGDQDDRTYTSGTDIPIGKIVVTANGTLTANGINFSPGKTTIGVVKWGETTPFKTITIEKK